MVLFALLFGQGLRSHAVLCDSASEAGVLQSSDGGGCCRLSLSRGCRVFSFVVSHCFLTRLDLVGDLVLAYIFFISLLSKVRRLNRAT
jgi:hypothetical protein